MARIALMPIALLAASAWMPGCSWDGYHAGNISTWDVVKNLVIYLEELAPATPLMVAFYVGLAVVCLGPLLAYRRVIRGERWVWRLIDFSLFSSWAVIVVLQWQLQCHFRYGFYLLAASFSLQWAVLKAAGRVGRRIRSVA